jgi:hypothetical protein
MSDIIQGLDVIFKLVPQLKSIAGLRRREYFERLIHPLFESFQTAHEFYINLILSTRREIVDLHIEAGAGNSRVWSHFVGASCGSEAGERGISSEAPTG